MEGFVEIQNIRNDMGGLGRIEGILSISGSLNKLKRKGSTLSNLSGPPKLNNMTAFFI